MEQAYVIYSGEDAAIIARRKARYGHRDQVVWRDQSGALHTARVSAASLKAAMLATGTQGRFTVYSGTIALSSSSWAVAVAWFCNARAGYWY